MRRGFALPGTETVDLLDAAGRVLAEPVLADRDIPPFPRSTRDGYAVRSADLTNLPATLDVIAEIRAGEKPEAIPSSLGPGQTASIMTGAPVPSGADAVVMVEYTSRQGSQVEITRTVTSGENVVPRGAEAAHGSGLLNPGVRLNEVAVALAASAGKSRLEVYRRPRVAVLTTGDEIVEVKTAPGPTQIRNSNSYSLAVQIRRAGGATSAAAHRSGRAPGIAKADRKRVGVGPVGDDWWRLHGPLRFGRGGFVGNGGRVFFHRSENPARPPGCVWPLWRGRSRPRDAGHIFLRSPGQSDLYHGDLRTLRAPYSGSAGRTVSPERLTFLHARLKREIRVKTGLKRFLPAVLSGEFEKSEVELVAWQGSGDIAATARANCYAVIPADRETVAAGEWVAVLPR